MSDLATLVGNIARHYGDATARLVLADYLEESGLCTPEQAAFIRGAGFIHPVVSEGRLLSLTFSGDRYLTFNSRVFNLEVPHE